VGFDHYAGFGANNPVVSPDGTHVAFGLKVEGEEGEGDGILLLDLVAPAPAAANPAAPASPAPTAPAPGSPASDADAGRLPATGSNTALPVVAALVALAALIDVVRRSPAR
jgi:hypothetical protein